MIRIDEHTVELTEAEQVIKEWCADIMNDGMSQRAAVAYILESVPQDGVTAKLLRANEAEFSKYLAY